MGTAAERWIRLRPALKDSFSLERPEVLKSVGLLRARTLEPGASNHGFPVAFRPAVGGVDPIGE